MSKTSDALRRVSPDVARRLPEGVHTRLLGVSEGDEEAALRVWQHAQNVGLATPIAFAAAALLALAALAAAATRRDAVLRLGVAIAVAAGLLGVAVTLAPRILADTAPGRAVLEVWLDPLSGWAWVLAAAGVVVALAAASVIRPVAVWRYVRRAWDVMAVPRDRRARAARGLAAAAVGIVALIEPRAVLEVVAAGAGLLLAVWGVSELLALTAPVPRLLRGRRDEGRRRARPASTASSCPTPRRSSCSRSRTTPRRPTPRR
jgi:hypothetical protein